MLFLQPTYASLTRLTLTASKRTSRAEPVVILNRKFGPFVLVKKLAIGGMAEIFLALKNGPGNFEKFVVVKRILQQYNDNVDFVRLFYREAELSGRLDHPNVVHTFDCDVHDGIHYMVMEQMQGVTVAEMAERAAELGQALPQDFAIRICIDACEGLHYVHQATNDGVPMRVVHRDLSPQNVFVTFDGVSKVFDFGIARLAQDDEDDPHGGMLAGKYAYMSPEQCRGELVDARSDIYSLGIILYELTTGYRLFKRDNQVLTLRAITEEPMLSPSDLLDRYPRFLERVVLKALAKDRAERYQTALEFADDLRKFLKISGSKPTPHLLGDYLRELFAPEIVKFLELRRDAVREATATHGRRDPIAELSKRAPKSEEYFIDDDDVLTPDLGPIVAAPTNAKGSTNPQFPIPNVAKLHIPDRPTGPQRLAVVKIADDFEEENNGFALEKAQRTNRLLAIIALLAIIIGGGAVAYFVTQKPPTPDEPEVHGAQPESSGGTLKISSTPIGADIYINGSLREKKTPADVQVPFGQQVEVDVRSEGFLPYKKDITLVEGQKVFIVEARLKEGVVQVPKAEVTAPVRVVSTPAGGRVVYDGRAMDGVTPLIIPEAKVGLEHVLVVDADGYETRILPFTLESETELELELELRSVDIARLGTLIIDSWPRGARVEIDERYAGTTPLPPLRLESNVEHAIAVTAPRLQPYTEAVTLKQGETRSLSPRLTNLAVGSPDMEEAQDNVALIDIKSDPPAEVFVDSVSVGHTPLESVMVAPGTHWLEFRDETQGLRHIEVVSFQEYEVTDLDIKIPKGTLLIDCAPVAKVRLDGQEVGQTPLELEVYVGEHKVVFEANGKTKENRVSVKAKKTVKLNEKL